MIINLSPKEISMCKQAATMRWQMARLSGVQNQRRDSGRSDNDLDYLGLRAELSVSKAFDIEHNLFQLGIDEGADIWLGDISIDVKSTFYMSGRLLFKSASAFKSSCAVLVCEKSETEMFIAGYTPKKFFIKNCYEKDLGHGSGLAMDQKDLRPISNLWEVHVKQKQRRTNNE
jgi:hypothetical protein